MTCKECQRLVPDYLNNDLKAKELESFITHVRSCPDCYEELETYFIIKLATQVLEDSADLSYDIKSMLQQDLAEKENLLYKKRRRILILMVLILVFLLADIVLTLHLLGVL
ncbi:MAG TPA: zf-HC2 domain-containing protein [Candidatus Pelethocola excrementipullorum]|nr:zf-HC2 domain-containing protein [Candidatus Pelethocola excrementipullorum]